MREETIPVQELESLDDLDLLIPGDVVRIVNEREKKSVVAYIAMGGPHGYTVVFVKPSPESSEHVVSLRIPLHQISIKEGSIHYKAGGCMSNELHRDEVGGFGKMYYDILNKSGLVQK